MRSPLLMELSASIVLSLGVFGLKLVEIVVETIEAFRPEPAVMLDPVRRFLETLGFEPAGPALRVAAAGNEPGALQHLQMFRDRRLAEMEGLHQLFHRSLARSETGEDRPPRRVGEGAEGLVEMHTHRSPISYITE